ncbi:TlpA disulfide reductase family protein [Bacteroides sp.]|uniref:TlpA disulfide reductase family protein n=1 Tax=Bacteroides sp. TaxID=29523 RepID=UPI001B6F90B9|nr:TlpA disulfide reductase family protein [Bacteroides sp.]MBP9578048.1 AhpC/TSA family protein [Parabacteroides sp.]MBP6068368.1 AhpC/TSA family protein [Bacteroides sp.]MBP6937443.1 AhpC/TSA family protein [Bacteroides sp.]MBP8622936.1 AhpC/TSA family protein [Bacteroides sp.]MBP9506728.1 AhpC/TSA family protein [Bacteroides sp.]
MKKITLVAFVALAVSACNSGPQFKVNGEVSGADGKTLYLEASGLEGVTLLDSVKLKGNGSFSFKKARPEAPEFYRLRVDEKVINFAVDSTETIQIDAPYVDFATAYTVEGSDNSAKIKELTIKQTNLQKNVDALIQTVRANKLSPTAFEDSLAVLLNNYKNEVKINYIFAAPNTSAAYFALFQKLNDYLIFDPLNNKDDVKCFAAVATSLNNFYPHANRSKNLYNIVIKGMKNTRTPQQRTIELPEDKIVETGLIDVSLRDIKGNVRKLSDLKGKVVLLDFSVFQTQTGAPHNLMLRELYNEYAAQGFEIYQVSLDADEHYWKTTADNLPWICVRDGNGVYSSNAAVYNVKQLPAYFLINRNNELSARGEDVKDLSATIKSLL